MPYPEKLLNEDEEIVEHLHPHWLTLVPAVLAFLVICGSVRRRLRLSAGRAGPMEYRAHQVLLLAIVVASPVVLLIWLTLAPIIRWRSTHYVLQRAARC